jgi:hypothetical protein
MKTAIVNLQNPIPVLLLALAAGCSPNSKLDQGIFKNPRQYAGRTVTVQGGELDPNDGTLRANYGSYPRPTVRTDCHFIGGASYRTKGTELVDLYASFGFENVNTVTVTGYFDGQEIKTSQIVVQSRPIDGRTTAETLNLR